MLATSRLYGEPGGIIGKFESFEGVENDSGGFEWVLGHGWEFRPDGVLIIHSYWNPGRRTQNEMKLPIHQEWIFHYKVLSPNTLLRTDDHGHEDQLAFELKPDSLLIGRGEPDWYSKVKKFRFER